MKKLILVLLLLAALAVAWLYWQPTDPVNTSATVSNVVKQAPKVAVPAQEDNEDSEDTQEGTDADGEVEASVDAEEGDDDLSGENEDNSEEESVQEGEVFVPDQPLAEISADAEANTDTTGAAYTLASNSTVEWRGTKVGGAHNGYVPVSDGVIIVSNGVIQAGSFTLAMDEIKATDIDSTKLDETLKEWFNASEYPTATFDIVEVGATSVQGNLTINGITKTITFPAVIIVEDDVVIANADFSLDRNEWDVAEGTPAVSEFMDLSLSLTWSKQ